MLTLILCALGALAAGLGLCVAVQADVIRGLRGEIVDLRRQADRQVERDRRLRLGLERLGDLVDQAARGGKR